MIASFGRFTLQDSPGVGPCWCPPDGVSALIDLVPPGQDSDPDVNFAVMLSDDPLDSSDELWRFGTDHPTELNLSGSDRDAWESITGYRPTAATLAECIAEHLLTGSDPTGLDFTKPLTAGRNRGLSVHFGGEIWSHRMADWSDPLALPVMRVEAESLAQIYREQGETQYRLALGGLHKKYEFYGPVKGLIQWLFPSGRDDLPLMDELEPQTVITETLPSVSAIRTGQDNAWTAVEGTLNVNPAGSLTGLTSTALTAVLDYVFGGSDRSATWVQGVTSNAAGMFTRANVTLNDAYLCTNNSTALQHYKRVSGSYTSLVAVAAAVSAGNAIFASVVGSTLVMKVNGTQIDSRTDTAIASGTRSGARCFLTSGEVAVGPLVFDDLIGGGGSIIPVFMNQYRQRWL